MSSADVIEDKDGSIYAILDIIPGTIFEAINELRPEEQCRIEVRDVMVFGGDFLRITYEFNPTMGGEGAMGFSGAIGPSEYE